MATDQARLFPTSTTSYNESKRRQVGRYVSSIWSFPDSQEKVLYRWYGTLPKPLVKRMIEIYSPETVLDPFVGLGTTLDVAADLKIEALGLDTNPLGCLASEARLFGISSKEKLSNELARISSKLQGSLTGRASLGSSETDRYYADEKYRYSRKWFRKDSLSALLGLFAEIAEVEDEDLQRLFFVAAAQTVRDVASVDPRCTHHLVTKSKPFIDPVPLFVQAANSAARSVREEPANPDSIRVQQGSLLDSKSQPGQYDFILVHPPYLGVIHYHLIHRLATDVLDFVRSSKNPSTLEKYTFDYDTIKGHDVSTDNSEKYKKFIENLAPILEGRLDGGGRCAVIIGDQRNRGHLRHPAIDFVNEMERNKLVLEELFIWVLQNNAGMHVLRRGHFIDHNYIQIFHKR